MIIYVQTEVQRCNSVLSEWCSTAAILQLSCKNLILSEDAAIRRQFWKIHASLSQFSLMSMFFPRGFYFLISLESFPLKFFLQSKSENTLPDIKNWQFFSLLWKNCLCQQIVFFLGHRFWYFLGITISPVSVYALTCLWCGDVDDYCSSGCWTQVWHSILALDSEAVVGVWLQVGDQHGGWGETKLSGHKMDTATTRRTLPAITRALPAVEAVGDVSPASCVSGWWPLQGHTGLIHCGDGVLWSRWRTWGKTGTYLLTCTFFSYL